MYEIVVNDLSKKFVKMEKKSLKVEFYAVNKISFNVKKGEVVGILGMNGAGKTTLLRMLGQLMKPTEGIIKIKDNENDINIKKYIGYLSCNTKLYNRFSVVEMLKTFAQIYKIDENDAISRINNIIKILDMSTFADNRVEKLSTGQLQRANIARCLIHNPDIYIFDEPTLGLDIMSSQSILEFMKEEKQKKKTIIYSTHYMEEAQSLCDRVLILYKGKVIEQGKINDLMTNYDTDNLRDAFYKIMEKTR